MGPFRDGRGARVLLATLDYRLHRRAEKLGLLSRPFSFKRALEQASSRALTNLRLSRETSSQEPASAVRNSQDATTNVPAEVVKNLRNAVERTDENSGSLALPVGCRFWTHATRFMGYDFLQVVHRGMTILQTVQKH